MGGVDFLDKGVTDEGQGEIVASHLLGDLEFRPCQVRPEFQILMLFCRLGDLKFRPCQGQNIIY